MIPSNVLDDLDAVPLSQQLRSAAGELSTRIDLGEFDDLDEGLRVDLQGLAQMMEVWAGRALALEVPLAATAPMSARPMTGRGAADA